jgi:hypothetical protein
MNQDLKKIIKASLICACMIILFACSMQAEEKKEEKSKPRPNLMVNPEIDTGEPFGYLAKPTTCLSVIGAPHGTQVCFDGSLHTASSELCFFYGESLEPIMARTKTLLEGWIPVVEYSFKDGDIEYKIEAFASMLSEDLLSPMINFVKVDMENRGTKEAKISFAVATRFTGEDHRFNYRDIDPFSTEWIYEMTNTELIRDKKLILCYPEGGARFAVPDSTYENQFKGSKYFVTDRTEVGLVKYTPSLAPGKKYSLVFKHPFNAIPVSEKENIDAIKEADYEQHRTKTIEAWKAEMAKGAQLFLPEKKVLDAHRANLMYTWMAITLRDGNWMQCVNKFQYQWFWLRDAAYIIHNHDVWGHHELAEKVLENYPKYQDEEGLFSSQKGQLDGFGQALFALGQHAIFKADGGYAEKIFPHFAPAVNWLKKARAADPFHLMPKTEARDNEMIIGHYTGHNYWALLGLRTAARIAMITGREKEAKTFVAEYDDLYGAFMKRLKEVAGENGYIPPGLDVEGGQDWGNLIGLYPTEVLDPTDARIATTLDKMHREKFQEGLMTYSGRLHQYLTVKEAQNHVVRGEQEQALKDFYAILVHMGSCNEMFEWRAVPWGDRDVGGNFSPHGWGAAMFNLMLRNMLILEWGGKGGLDAREMHLFSVLSPAWVIPGKEISLKDAPTELGKLSLVLKCTEKGADLSIEKKFHTPPEKFVLHIPYFVDLTEFKTDAKDSRKENDRIILSPDVTSVNLSWKRREVEPLNFEKAVQDYKTEYAKRYKEYISGGNTPIVVEAPKMLSKEEREIEYKTLYSPEVLGIAYKKSVKTSGPYEEGHGPKLAVDGNIKDPNVSSWWAAPPLPKWLEVDLEKPYKIGAIQVFPYWDGSRYYQYTVEISTDGKEWKQAIDMSSNTKPSTAKGDYHEIEPEQARYVRVNMLYNSANPSVHLVEIRVFEAK